MPDNPIDSFGSAHPGLRVKDVDASIADYRDILGFKLLWGGGDFFASVARGKCNLFLTNDNQSQPRMWVWIGVEDVRVYTPHT